MTLYIYPMDVHLQVVCHTKTKYRFVWVITWIQVRFGSNYMGEVGK